VDNTCSKNKNNNVSGSVGQSQEKGYPKIFVFIEDITQKEQYFNCRFVKVYIKAFIVMILSKIFLVTRSLFLAYQTGVSVTFIHAGNFIWHGGFQISRVLYNGTIKMTSFYRYE
jgi:hypothetical protein